MLKYLVDEAHARTRAIGFFACAAAIAIATGSNTVAKCIYAATLGGTAYAARFSLVSLVGLAALAAGLLAASAQMPG